MTRFEQGFYDELENIQKEGYLQYAIPAAAFAAYDVGKAVKEQAVSGPRTEEAKQKTYFTKYPSVGLVPGSQALPWYVGRKMEQFGRRGETPWHKALSTGAGTLGGIMQADPTVALQKGLGG